LSKAVAGPDQLKIESRGMMAEISKQEAAQIREESKNWHYANKRSGHNPYHPRNGSIALCIQANMGYMLWYRMTDLKGLTNYQSMELFMRNTSTGVELCYGIGAVTYKFEIEYADGDSIIKWLNNALKQRKSCSKQEYDHVAHNFVKAISLQELEGQLEQYKREHEIELVAADNTYLKMLQDRVSGE
jgi:hypothetical protein